jgi:chromosome segregation ATPase
MQKNAFIIDHDRELALKIAAALRGDDLKVSIAEEESDIVEQLQSRRPDLVLMRAEGEDRDSGFVLCSRVKGNRRLKSTPVFVYATNESEEAFARHREQETRADAYLTFPGTIPYAFDDLKEQARTLLFPGIGKDRPPPILPKKDWGLAGRGKDLSTTTDDLSIDGENKPETIDDDDAGPSSDIGSKVGGAGLARRTTADKKLEMLRQKLRQRETDLQVEKERCRTLERASHEWNEQLVEKDVEAQSLRMTIEEVTAAGESLRAQLERRTKEFNASFEQLLQDKIDRENELITAVAAKEKSFQDMRKDLESKHGASVERGNKLEEELKELTLAKEKAAQEILELRADLKVNQDTVESLTASLEEMRIEAEALESDRKRLEAQVVAQQERIAHLEDTILALRGDLSLVREEVELSINEHEATVQARDRLVDSLRDELTALDERAQLETEELQSELTDLGTRLAAETATLVEMSARAATLEKDLASLKESSQRTESLLRAQNAELIATLDSERIERAEAEESLLAQLEASKKSFLGLESAFGAYRAEAEHRESELHQQLQERSARIVTLEGTVVDVRTKAQHVETALRQENERLESERLGAEQEAEEREADLRANLSSTAASLESTRQAAERLERDLADRNARLQAMADKIASVEVQLAEESERYEELKVEFADDRARRGAENSRLIDQLEGVRQTAHEHEEALKREVVELGAQLKDRNDRLSDLERNIERTSRERNESMARVAQLQDELGLLAGQHQELSDELRGLEKDLATTRETLALREGRISEMQDALSEEKRDRAASDEHVSALLEDLDLRSAENGRLEGRVSVLSENNNSLKTEVVDLEKQLQEVRESLSAKHSEWTGLRVEAEERARQLSEAQEAIQSLKQGRKELRDELNRSTREAEDLKGLLEALREEKDGLDAELAQVAADLGETQGASENFRKQSRDQQNQLERRIEELLAQQAQASSGWSKEKSSLETEIAVLSGKVQSVEGLLEQSRRGMERDAERFSKEAHSLAERLAEATQRASVLAADKKGLEDEAGRERQSSIEARSRLEVQIKALEAQRGLLDDTVQALEQELEEAKHDREDIEARYLKEIEEANEEHIRKAKLREHAHAEELDRLRKDSLEAKRKMKETELESMRASDRLKKLESHTVPKSSAEADFESFVAQYASQRAQGSKRPTQASTVPVTERLPVPEPVEIDSSPPVPPPPPPLSQKVSVPPVLRLPSDRQVTNPVRGFDDDATLFGEDEEPRTASVVVSDDREITATNAPVPLLQQRRVRPRGETEVPEGETNELLQAFDREFQ